MSRSSTMSSKILSSLASSKYSLNGGEDEEIDTYDPSQNIKVIDNQIFFYADVDSTTIIYVISELQTLIKEMQITGIKLGINPPPITMFINSEGGEVHSALSLHDFIKSSPVEIITVITGNACSAATIISMAGHHRKITKNSYMLIHNISSTFWGKMHEFEDEMKNMSKLTLNLKAIYKENSKINKRTIDSLLKKDLLLDADTCLSYGFVDEII